MIGGDNKSSICFVITMIGFDNGSDLKHELVGPPNILMYFHCQRFIIIMVIIHKRILGGK